MREVALVQTTYRALTREEELAVEEGTADDDRRLVLVVIVVVDDRLRSSRPRGRVHRGPVLRPGSLPPEVDAVTRRRSTGRGGICSR